MPERSRQACEACRWVFLSPISRCTAYHGIIVGRRQNAQQRGVRVLESQVKDLYRALQSVTARSKEVTQDEMRGRTQSSAESPNPLVDISEASPGVNFTLSE
ncbi:hypothetical protein BDV25DRAFT_143198 [Aspergillus avenaceus]|uniref:Uncharacterized protein n=1 Tax=Aspergillus avenaceus TaxID=36643 RepID=A0A5N6TKU0_ASPAV|nr:hypothetical protein BDV25DRAFT_143198 [Aspergillus avenaceus]